QRVGELYAVDHLVLQAGALGDVELVPVAVAGAQTLISLARLVQRIEIHDQVELVVRARGNPGVGVGVVGARLVEDRQSFAMARAIRRASCRGEQGRHDQCFRISNHVYSPSFAYTTGYVLEAVAAVSLT